jgi:hypothetical protein
LSRRPETPPIRSTPLLFPLPHRQHRCPSPPALLPPPSHLPRAHNLVLTCPPPLWRVSASPQSSQVQNCPYSVLCTICVPTPT